MKEINQTKVDYNNFNSILFNQKEVTVHVGPIGAHAIIMHVLVILITIRELKVPYVGVSKGTLLRNG